MSIENLLSNFKRSTFLKIGVIGLALYTAACGNTPYTQKALSAPAPSTEVKYEKILDTDKWYRFWGTDVQEYISPNGKKIQIVLDRPFRNEVFFLDNEQEEVPGIDYIVDEQLLFLTSYQDRPMPEDDTYASNKSNSLKNQALIRAKQPQARDIWCDNQEAVLAYLRK